MKRGFFKFVILFFLSVSSLFGESSVWKISDAKHTMYLGGTIHLLRSSDYPLPSEFDKAYSQADYVVFETDLARTQSELFAAMLAQKMILPLGQTLANKLTSKTYAELTSYLASQRYTIRMFDRLEPWAAVLTLTQLKLAQMGMDQSGVDMHYSRRALSDHLPQRYLETIAEQIDIITGIGAGEEDVMILQALHDMKQLDSMIPWMVEEWRQGKTARLERELVQDMKNESPKMYQHILKQRNDRWKPKLIAMMQEDKIGFVLIGAMHLLGEDGLLEQFRMLGYQVELFKE
ncbi:TraB/GumN family protein [Sulfuricurvum sp.]|uniref:TraB/GumN family protein n=1 Tax=Sulfuricurvum sp. TaxID=2025608 RepID=UPI003C3C75EB